MDGQECSTCRFWRQQGIHQGKDHGECRRYPPVLNPVVVRAHVEPSDWEDEGYEQAVRVLTCWNLPLVAGDQWCGEWRLGRAARDF